MQLSSMKSGEARLSSWLRWNLVRLLGSIGGKLAIVFYRSGISNPALGHLIVVDKIETDKSLNLGHGQGL